MHVIEFEAKNAPKNNDEWLKLRKSGIGASECSCIVGASPYMSNLDLWRIKTGRKQAENISNNAYVAYGHAAEGPIRELFALDYPEYTVSYGGAFDMVHNPKYPWIFATLDGRLVEKGTGRKGILEIKTTEIVRSMQREKWWSDGEPCIPQNYYCQVCWQLLATGWDFVILHAQLKYRYGNDVRTERRSYSIERDEVLDDLDYLQDEAIKFWKYVQEDREPPLVLPW